MPRVSITITDGNWVFHFKPFKFSRAFHTRFRPMYLRLKANNNNITLVTFSIESLPAYSLLQSPSKLSPSFSSMADSEASQTTEPLLQSDGGEANHLKYLDFVQTAVIYFVVCFASVYGYAKENAGSLKPGIQTVENTVKTVIGPVYEKFHYVPFETLKFLDLKVDDLLTELNRHVPSLMKELPSQVKYTAQNFPEVAKTVASEALKTATNVAHTLYVKYEPTAKELYKNYEPVAEKYAVSTWRSLNKLPVFPQVAQIAVPTGAYVLEKYNYIVVYSAEKGYVVAQYLPLVPIDKIAKVFEEGENGSTVGQSVEVET